MDSTLDEGTLDEVNRADYWSEAYKEGRTGWDLGTPTPVFEDLLFNPGQLPDGSRAFEPGKTLIPCSGHGYDALLFALHGFEVTAVDFAPEPLRRLAGAAEDEGVSLNSLLVNLLSQFSAFCGPGAAPRR